MTSQMAGQNKTRFLTKNSKISFHNDVNTTTTTKTATSSRSLFRPCSFLQNFLLTLLLLQSCLLHYGAAYPASSSQQAPNESTTLQEDSRPNKYVNIPKINKDRGLFLGDIKLSSLQQSIYEIISTRKFYPQSPLPQKMVQLWEDGFIYYDTSSISGRASRDYIKFTEGSGCWSYLGKQGGPQEISIGSPSCRYRNVIIHLIFHAIGFVHEESRPDRDLNVEIDFDNIAPGKETNFDILPEQVVRSDGTNYNYRSIMHSLKRLSSRLTATGYKDTIRPKGVLSYGKNFGAINSLTPGDITRVKSLYCPFNLVQNTWTKWSVWSRCSVTCNSGTKYRTRICNKPDNSHVCSGSNYEVARCHQRPCRGIDRSLWGQWGEWSKCSASCGGGRQVRVRQCLGGDVCTRGKGRQYRQCSINRCPGTQWSDWSQWTTCSKTCHYGKKTRTRTCIGSDCSGPTQIIRLCNFKIPCSPVWGQWSNWTSCTEGKVMRTRACRLEPYKCRGPHREYLNCSENGSKLQVPMTTTGQLPTTESWTPWSPCSTSCGPGEQERSNSCGKLGECRQMLQMIILLSFLYLSLHILPSFFMI